MYQHIYCPIKNIRYNINSSYGNNILKNYINMLIVNSKGGKEIWESISDTRRAAKAKDQDRERPREYQYKRGQDEYEKGDLTTAIYWYNLAAQKEHPEAAKAKAEAEAVAEFTEVQAEAEAAKEAYADIAANPSKSIFSRIGNAFKRSEPAASEPAASKPSAIQISVSIGKGRHDKDIKIYMKTDKLDLTTFKKAYTYYKTMELKSLTTVEKQAQTYMYHKKDFDQDFQMIQFHIQGLKDPITLDIKNEKEINILLKEKIFLLKMITLRKEWLVKKLSEAYINCEELPPRGKPQYWEKCHPLIRCNDLTVFDKKTYEGIEENCNNTPQDIHPVKIHELEQPRREIMSAPMMMYEPQPETFTPEPMIEIKQTLNGVY